jgi:hypothetical protein
MNLTHKDPPQSVRELYVDWQRKLESLPVHGKKGLSINLPKTVQSYAELKTVALKMKIIPSPERVGLRYWHNPEVSGMRAAFLNEVAQKHGSKAIALLQVMLIESGLDITAEALAKKFPYAAGEVPWIEAMLQNQLASKSPPRSVMRIFKRQRHISKTAIDELNRLWSNEYYLPVPPTASDVPSPKLDAVVKNTYPMPIPKPAPSLPVPPHSTRTTAKGSQILNISADMQTFPPLHQNYFVRIIPNFSALQVVTTPTSLAADVDRLILRIRKTIKSEVPLPSFGRIRSVLDRSSTPTDLQSIRVLLKVLTDQLPLQSGFLEKSSLDELRRIFGLLVTMKCDTPRTFVRWIDEQIQRHSRLPKEQDYLKPITRFEAADIILQAALDRISMK